MVAGGVGIAGIAGDGVLGGQHELVPAVGEEFAGDFLARALLAERHGARNSSETRSPLGPNSL